ncbi:MAG TPA: patatin-like phospholipase family protein [Alphaproteobacteria bacterium]
MEAEIRHRAARLFQALGRALEPRAPLALGLQGGGALGAFTWGVLDGLLAAPDFACAAASGASAGAVNAVLLASGLMQGGPARARHVLRQFWERASRKTPAYSGPALGAWLDHWRERMMWPAALPVSPYHFNPLNHNPLREILGDLVDFDLLRRPEAPRLFVSATDVGTGKARTFANGEISLAAVLASACLPQLFHAVEIDGRHYWDGGFTANPPVEPLRKFARRARLLFVILNASAAPELPKSAPGIANRLNQIMGNATLLRELKGLGRYEKIEIADYARLDSAGAKLNNDWQFIQRLFTLGAGAAKNWLAGRAPSGAAR